MSGSSESNEDLVAGRVNRANDQTTIWAENPFTEGGDPIFGPHIEPAWGTFNGKNILLVEISKNSEAPLLGDFRPDQPVDAIVGIGWSGTAPGGTGGTGVTGIGGKVDGTGLLGSARGRGTGVMGMGGPREGAGVVGFGSGGEAGGTGVHGVGGRAQLQEDGTANTLPGAGVFGQGGRIVGSNPERLLHGAGVIGVGGDAANSTIPPASETGGVGVFGQGAEALITVVDETVFGPAEPGAGLLGRGGVSIPNDGKAGAGVIGLAGGETKPSIDDTANAGVFGMGLIGVRGIGSSRDGVSGHSSESRGGIFSTNRAAQINLVPKSVQIGGEATIIEPIGISQVSLANGAVPLPKDGRSGDLMALVNPNDGNSTLWFCVRGLGSGPARWAQVLLGPPFKGVT
jgi:hypothetical protein